MVRREPIYIFRTLRFGGSLVNVDGNGISLKLHPSLSLRNILSTFSCSLSLSLSLSFLSNNAISLRHRFPGSLTSYVVSTTLAEICYLRRPMCKKGKDDDSDAVCISSPFEM